MFCSKCGFEISGDDKFCPKCGANHVKGDNNQEKSININGMNMTAEGMVQYCIDNDYIKIPESSKKLGKKEWKHYFENIIAEIQSDETPLLCFAGMHNYKSKWNNSGQHSYILTNKRLITSGLYNKNSSSFNPLAMYGSLFKICVQKHPKFCVDAVYLRDVIGIRANMVDGSDVITFQTTKGDLNIMLYNSNLSHQLCDKINATLKQIKEA